MSDRKHADRSVTPCLKAGACVWTPPQLGIPRKACRFDFSVRHIGAYRQDTRPCPVLPDKERSHRDIPGTDQISMERVMTVLTDEQQAFVGAVGLTGMPTHRAGFAGIVGIDFDGHASGQEGFVGNHALQFSKGPFGVGCIGLALLPAGLFAFLALYSSSDVCQVFQADEAVRVLVYDAFGHDMIGILLQPSLPSTQSDESPCRGTGAFLLKTLSQTRIMVGFGNHALSRMKRARSLGGRGDGQIAHPDIHSSHTAMGVGGGVCYRNFQGDEQIELLLGLIIPELGGADMGILLEQRHMLVVPCKGNDQTALQGEDAHLLCLLEAVVPMIVVGECRRHILWSLIQALVAFLRLASLTLCGILLHLRPQRLVGRADLARDITGHLSRQFVGSTEFPIHPTLQSLLIAHFAMLKGIARNRIEGIPIGQLGLPQGLELLRGGMQFQFGRHDLFHRTSILEFTGSVKNEFCEGLRQFLPVLESRGLLGAFVEYVFVLDSKEEERIRWQSHLSTYHMPASHIKMATAMHISVK